MSKSPISPEFKIQVCQEYLSRAGSYRFIAEEYGISSHSVERWVAKYRAYGPLCFSRSPGNAQYPKEFKEQCVKAVLYGQESVNDIVVKYNISFESVLRRWLMRYNANIGLKDYDSKWEVYMAEAKRKATLNERKKITEYCIADYKDYKGIAALFGASYSQVYSWIQKYEKQGEGGLTDKRGHHKSDEEVDELAHLR